MNFKIKGMSCNACAQIIAKELKNQQGVIEAKVDFASKSGLVIYDKTKIQKPDIFNAVKKAGDYQAKEIIENGSPAAKETEDKGEEKSQEEAKSFSQETQKTGGSRNQFLTGLLVGGGAVFLLVNIFFSITLKPLSLQAKADTAGNSGLNQKQKQNQNAGQVPPINEAQETQTFAITEADYIRGNPNASITLVEFSDFECPFCEKQYRTLKQLLDEYPQKIRLVYKHFPLGFHKNAQKAAEASECAGEQDKFWEYHDKLFENQNSYSVENFKKWAQGLGLKTSQFNSCLDSGKYAQKVLADAKEGQQKGVDGTPATFINGQLISGALPYDTFKEAIDSL